MKKNIFTKTVLLSLSILFFVWILFLDDFNLIRQWKLKKVKKDLEEKEKYYQSTIKRDSTKLYHLRTNKDSLEKYGREKYLMKKENEDIFLIIDEKEQE